MIHASFSVPDSVGDRAQLDHDKGHGAVTLRRFSLRDMAPAALALALEAIKERVLPDLERQAPAVVQALRLGVRAQ